MVHGAVVCGCFTYDDNPELPSIILPGTRPDIEAEAAEFSKGYGVPVFVKLAPNEWVHIGVYRVVRRSVDPTEIENHQGRSRRKRIGRDRISQILYLEPVGEHFDLKTMNKITDTQE